jgi:hypothetical protein
MQQRVLSNSRLHYQVVHTGHITRCLFIAVALINLVVQTTNLSTVQN